MKGISMSLHQRLFRARTGVVLAVCLATLVGLTACGSSSSSGKAASSSTSDGSASSGTAGSSTRAADTGAPVNVAIELVQSGLAFTQETQAGAEAAAQEFNAHLSVSAPTQLDPTTAISQVSSALSQGAKGIAIADIPSSSWTRELSTAMSQTNGNVVAFNAPPVAGTAKTYVGNSDVALGQKLAAAAIKAAHLGPNTTGQVIISNCAPGASLLAVTVKGEVDTVKQLLPKATIEPPFDSQATPSANSTAWQQEISAHPSTVLALGTCDQDGDSMIKAKQSTGGKFAIGASDLDPLVLKGIADGTVAADLAQNWYLEGYTATRMLIDAARNHTTPPAGWFQPGTTVVTKANVATLETRDASAAGVTAFYKPIIAKFWSNISAAAQSLSAAV
jgi:ribose transport system substrate-binding protein